MRVDLTVPFRRKVIRLSPQPERFAWRTWIADYQPQHVDAEGRKWFSGNHRHAHEFTFNSIGDAESYLRRWRFDWTAKVWQ